MPNQFVKIKIADNIAKYIQQVSKITLLKVSNYVNDNFYYIKKADLPSVRMLIKKYQRKVIADISEMYRQEHPQSRILAVNILRNDS